MKTAIKCLYNQDKCLREREAQLIHDELEWYLNVAVGQWSPYRHLVGLSDLHRIQSCVNTLPLALSAVGINSFSCF